jgi:excisionase family DNA binding protein
VIHADRGDDAMISSDTPPEVLPRLGERLLTIDQAATVLNLSKPTVYRLIRDGELKPYRVRGRLRFTPEQLREYVLGGS